MGYGITGSSVDGNKISFDMSDIQIRDSVGISGALILTLNSLNPAHIDELLNLGLIKLVNFDEKRKIEVKIFHNMVEKYVIDILFLEHNNPPFKEKLQNMIAYTDAPLEQKKRLGNERYQTQKKLNDIERKIGNYKFEIEELEGKKHIIRREKKISNLNMEIDKLEEEQIPLTTYFQLIKITIRQIGCKLYKIWEPIKEQYENLDMYELERKKEQNQRNSFLQEKAYNDIFGIDSTDYSLEEKGKQLIKQLTDKEILRLNKSKLYVNDFLKRNRIEHNDIEESNENTIQIIAILIMLSSRELSKKLNMQMIRDIVIDIENK